MALLALAAPTLPLVQLPTASALPAAETALGANTGFTFPNNGFVIVRIVVGAAGTGNITFAIRATVDGLAPAIGVVDPGRSLTLANSTPYLFGPFKPSIYNDASGLVTCDMAVVTGNSAGVYILPNGAQ